MLAVLHSSCRIPWTARHSRGVGEALLAANEESGTFTGHTATRLANIRLRRDLLATRVVDPYAAIGVSIGASNYALRLLLSYADVLGDAAVTMTADGRRTITDNIYDLAALAIGGVHDGRAQFRGVRAARLHALKTDIRRNLSQPGLSIAEVARRHGISGSYARRLFAGDGTSFSDYVLDQRLTLAHRLLIDSPAPGAPSAPLPTMSVSAICPTSTVPSAAVTA